MHKPASILLRSSVILSASAVFAASAMGQGSKNPFLGADHFPQFRQISGLSGGGYGLDLDGWGSLSGPTAFSTPLGVGLGHDQFRLLGGETFFDWKTLSHGNSTGKAAIEYGHTFGPITFSYSYFIKSTFGDESTNLQLSYNPGNTRVPNLSVGVQDIVGNGGSAGENIPGDKASSRSFFGALTYQLQTGSIPVYVSGGWGTRRFGKGFASASAQLGSPVRLWTEFDGFGFNEGVLLTYRQNDHNEEGQPQHTFEADLMLGVIRGKYPTIAVTVGY